MNEITFEADIASNRLLRLPDALPVGARARIKITLMPPSEASTPDNQPINEIARLAQAAREAHLASGGELMGPDEIAAEVRRRRGGIGDD